MSAPGGGSSKGVMRPGPPMSAKRAPVKQAFPFSATGPAFQLEPPSPASPRRSPSPATSTGSRTSPQSASTTPGSARSFADSAAAGVFAGKTPLADAAGRSGDATMALPLPLPSRDEPCAAAHGDAVPVPMVRSDKGSAAAAASSGTAGAAAAGSNGSTPRSARDGASPRLTGSMHNKVSPRQGPGLLAKRKGFALRISLTVPERPVTLEDPIPVGDEFRSHLMKLATRKSEMVDGFDEELEHVKELTRGKDFALDQGGVSAGRADPNASKNRYPDVLPYEGTRVKLGGCDDASGYINANWVAGEHISRTSGKAYIAAQAPLDETTGDFWRMVWESDAKVILMLGKEVENFSSKCARYWVEVGQDAVHFGAFAVSCVDDETVMTAVGAPDEAAIVRRALVVTRTDEQGEEESRHVYHLQHASWPDAGVPTLAETDRLLCEVDALRERSTVVVHCSAGLGRTGTFIAIDTLRLKIDAEMPQAKVNVMMSVKRLREQRAGLVQTRDQYVFIYKYLLHWVEAHFPSVHEDDDDPDALLQTI